MHYIRFFFLNFFLNELPTFLHSFPLRIDILLYFLLVSGWWVKGEVQRQRDRHLTATVEFIEIRGQSMITGGKIIFISHFSDVSDTKMRTLWMTGHFGFWAYYWFLVIIILSPSFLLENVDVINKSKKKDPFRARECHHVTGAFLSDNFFFLLSHNLNYYSDSTVSPNIYTFTEKYYHYLILKNLSPFKPNN